jgi:hypothetical protein
MRSDFDAIFDSAIQAGWPGPFAFRAAALMLASCLDMTMAVRAFEASTRWVQ